MKLLQRLISATPHLGASSTKEAQEGVAIEIAEAGIVGGFERGACCYCYYFTEFINFVYPNSFIENGISNQMVVLN
ncbi:unnamed protein product [Trifolium pratense]|uniref:Uncharacterized protein n=1 Tax=Trifolium pratense TaxID=57577 RepID=A0ACB0KB80_TRIPR|nr:unnamed protein product [Trifolium pratense]